MTYNDHHPHPPQPLTPHTRPQLELITNANYRESQHQTPGVSTCSGAAHGGFLSRDPAALPDHVRDSFHVDAASSAKRLGSPWDYGWLVQNIVLIPVIHPDRAAWSSRLRENLKVDGVRIVAPVRTTDGRFINAGWRASVFVPGELGWRGDETIAAALRLDKALAQITIPDSFHLIDRKDIFSVADHAAWREEHDLVVLDPKDPTHETVAEWMPQIRKLMQPLVDASNNALPNQVTHADMFATTVYAGDRMPAVTDVVGVAHPYGYTAALALVDALLMNVVDVSVIERFRHVAALEQLILRGLLYRLYVHALHPDASSNSGTNLGLVCHAIMAYMSQRHGTI